MKLEKPFIFVMILSSFIFLSRMFPHSANFSPVIALTLIAGFLGKGRWYGFVLPLLALFLSDLKLGFYPGWALTYIPLVFAVVLGFFMKTKMISILTNSLLAATLFFLISNFGVWLYSGMYSQDFLGLLTCYELGIPFFKMTLASTASVMVVFYLAFLALDKLEQQGAVERI